MRASHAIIGAFVAALSGATAAPAQIGPAPAPNQSVSPPPGSRLHVEPGLLATPGAPLVSAAAAKKDGFVWDNRPGIRYGDWFRLDGKALLEGAVESHDPDDTGDGTSFVWGRRRFGVEGSVTKYVEYEATYGWEPDGLWRDVYVNVRPLAYAQVQGGKFKIPFGYERLTGPRSLDFVYRSRASDALTPGRSVGVMAHGRAFKRVIRYAAGVFEDDGDQPPDLESMDMMPDEQPQEQDRSWAARATVAPLRLTSLPGKYNNLEVGGAYAHTVVPEGRNHLQGDTVFGGEFFDRQYYTRGPRTRLGLEVSWAVGPAFLAAEYIVSREAREGQGVGNETQIDPDLPDIEGRGWYVAGTWVITGENRDGGVNPKRPLLQGGFGAIEVAARFEKLSFASAGPPAEPPSRSPRAANIAGNADSTWTIGVNWYVNRWAKLRFNFIDETLDDALMGPAPGAASLRTMVMMCQVGF